MQGPDEVHEFSGYASRVSTHATVCRGQELTYRLLCILSLLSSPLKPAANIADHLRERVVRTLTIIDQHVP
jgi:hypothetical protein